MNGDQAFEIPEGFKVAARSWRIHQRAAELASGDLPYIEAAKRVERGMAAFEANLGRPLSRHARIAAQMDTPDGMTVLEFPAAVHAAANRLSGGDPEVYLAAADALNRLPDNPEDLRAAVESIRKSMAAQVAGSMREEGVRRLEEAMEHADKRRWAEALEELDAGLHLYESGIGGGSLKDVQNSLQIHEEAEEKRAQKERRRRATRLSAGTIAPILAEFLGEPNASAAGPTDRYELSAEDRRRALEEERAHDKQQCRARRRR